MIIVNTGELKEFMQVLEFECYYITFAALIDNYVIYGGSTVFWELHKKTW